MKNIFLLLFLLPAFAIAQQTTITPKKAVRNTIATPTVTATPAVPEAPVDPNAPAFKFVEEVWDFGTIPQGIPVTHVFQFENSGKQTLEINTVTTGCGCTTPEFSKEPVDPGKKGSVTVTYDAIKSGNFNKSVSLYSNTGSPKALIIKGTVLPKATAPAGSQE